MSLRAIAQLTGVIRERHPDAPIVLLGHSWGSLMAQILIGTGCAPAFVACTLFIATRFPAERFAAFCDQVLPGGPRSFANSSGIFLGGAFHFDLARPGAALYGVAPVAGQPNPMRPVIRLEGKVPHISIEGEDRQLKSAYARRVIPLCGVSLESMRTHPDGFPRYRDKPGLSATVDVDIRTAKADAHHG